MSIENEKSKDNFMALLMQREYLKNKNVLLAEVQKDKSNIYGLGYIQNIDFIIDNNNDIIISYGKQSFNLDKISNAEFTNNKLRDLENYLINAIKINEYRKNEYLKQLVFKFKHILIQLKNGI